MKLVKNKRARENRVRRKLANQGYLLRKCRNGGYVITHIYTGIVETGNFGFTLEEVEKFAN